jgi:stress response protein YsnF/sporulation protein YlmC with PRC-barrel domain
MTMQAQQLIGVQVTGGDGQVVGTVEQVFNDDADGRPVWARVRAGERERFVPLAGSRATGDGLSVPFNTRQIISGPELDTDRHMSAAQAEELNRHFGLSAASQKGQPGTGPNDPAGGSPKGPDAPAHGSGGGPKTQAHGERDDRSERGRRAGRGERGGRGEQPDVSVPPQAGRPDTEAQQDWIVRAEERLVGGHETAESGRARLHKYVDVEPVEQAVRVVHEEYEVERVPITAEDQIRGDIGEREQEIILHEERPVFRKETVAVERVRLSVRRVEEDRTYRDEVRKERIEVEADPARAESRRPERKTA